MDTQYGGAHEHKGPQDFADKHGGGDDDDDDDGGDDATAEKQRAYRKEAVSYGANDDEDDAVQLEMQKQALDPEDLEDEDEGIGGSGIARKICAVAEGNRKRVGALMNCLVCNFIGVTQVLKVELGHISLQTRGIKTSGDETQIRADGATRVELRKDSLRKDVMMDIRVVLLVPVMKKRESAQE